MWLNYAALGRGCRACFCGAGIMQRRRRMGSHERSNIGRAATVYGTILFENCVLLPMKKALRKWNRIRLQSLILIGKNSQFSTKHLLTLPL